VSMSTTLKNILRLYGRNRLNLLNNRPLSD
jgi:hypothetical protein